MRRISVCMCVVVVFSFALILIRQSQKMAAAPAAVTTLQISPTSLNFGFVPIHVRRGPEVVSLRDVGRFHSSTTKDGTEDYLDERILLVADADALALTGNCEYICPSTRCPELTGWCLGLIGGSCRAAVDLRNCPRGMPARRPGRNACGYGVDLARRCNP